MDLNYATNGLAGWDKLDNVINADFSSGVNENTFKLELARKIDDEILPANTAIWLDPVNAGIIRSVDIDENGEASYIGDTLPGLFGRHLLVPQNDFIEINATNAKEAVEQLITLLNWQDVFFCSGLDDFTEPVHHIFRSSVKEKNDDSSRFMNGWAALWQLATAHNFSTFFYFRKLKSNEPQKPQVEIKLKKTETFRRLEDLRLIQTSVAINFKTPANRLLCLGSGELSNRLKCDIFADENGDIVDNQALFNEKEVSEVFESSSSKTIDELRAEGVKKMYEKNNTSRTIQIIAKNKLPAFLGDIIVAKNPALSTLFYAKINQQITKIKNNKLVYEYRTEVL